MVSCRHLFKTCALLSSIRLCFFLQLKMLLLCCTILFLFSLLASFFCELFMNAMIKLLVMASSCASDRMLLVINQMEANDSRRTIYYSPPQSPRPPTSENVKTLDV